ncbi:hypothetical protein, partial [Aphanothece microscopica]|uniref:hypothetical protein n=1 Tax=Aphanothece microscopica TaxID=1049561 RepID=UPI003984BFED
MKTSHAALVAVLSLALPAAAESLENIGTMHATFDGEVITQTTVRFGQGDEQGATAEFGAGFGSTDLSIYGGDVGRQLSIELMFPGDAPGPASAPMLTAINWFPKGMSDHWSSEEAPAPPAITFS